VVKHTESGVEHMISFAQLQENVSAMSADVFDNARDHMYVNSWCLSELESMAMWEIYGSGGTGLALKSSVERYHAATQSRLRPDQYLFGKVEYHVKLDGVADLQEDFSEHVPVGSGLWPRVLRLGLHKRACFDHENEWRALLYQDRRDISGVNEPFDVDVLVSDVYLGPRASQLDFDVATAVMERFGLRSALRRSELLTGPRSDAAPA
jgi:hypothetical protein